MVIGQPIPGTSGLHERTGMARDETERPIRPVYAVHGDDAYLIQEAIGGVIGAVFPGEVTDAAVSRFPVRYGSTGHRA